MSNPPIPIEILYPNGRVLGTQVFVVSTITGYPIPWDGSVTGGGGGGGGAVSIADGSDVAEGSTGDAVWSGSGPGTVVALLKKIATGSSGTVFATITSGTITSIVNPVTVTGTIALTTTSSVSINGGVLAAVSGNVTATINNTTFNIASVTNPVHAIIDSGVITTISGGVFATITSGTITSIANPVTVTGTVNATVSGVVSATITGGTITTIVGPTTVVNDGSFATPVLQGVANSTLAQILANQIVPLGGPQAIAQNAYWVTHRLEEQTLIETMKNTIETIIGSESENSQRMGFELR